MKNNKDNISQKNEYEKRLKEIAEGIDNLDDKHYIKNEMTKEKYDTLTAKLETERIKILKLLEGCQVSTSNLSQKIIEASELSRNLTGLWQHKGYDHKLGLQKLVFPEGITFDKKKGVLLTPKINSAIVQIARLSGDLAINEKGLSIIKNTKSLIAEKEGFEPPEV